GWLLVGLQQLHASCTGVAHMADDVISITRIEGRGTLPGLCEAVRRELMAGKGVTLATDRYDVVDAICAVSDRMGGTVEIDLGDGSDYKASQCCRRARSARRGTEILRFRNEAAKPNFIAFFRSAAPIAMRGLTYLSWVEVASW